MTDTHELAHNHSGPLGVLASDMGNSFTAFNTAVFESEGEIPRKYRELIALGVALTTQCEGCLRGHTAAAVENGATDEELAETTYIAAALRAGGAIVHGLKVMSTASKLRD
jgi:AhpD family alkylhydroperoxidase